MDDFSPDRGDPADHAHAQDRVPAAATDPPLVIIGPGGDFTTEFRPTGKRHYLEFRQPATGGSAGEIPGQHASHGT